MTDDMLASVCERYYGTVRRYCESLLRSDTSGAEDCTQETFLILLQSQNELDANGIVHWLLNTARNTVCSYRRRKAVQPTPFAALPEGSIENVEDPSARIAAESSLAADVLETLSDTERCLLEAYCDQDQGARADLAEALGLSVSELYQLAYRLRRRLRRTMDEMKQKQNEN